MGNWGMSEYVLTRCEECGIDYLAGHPQDDRYHIEYHEKWEKANNHYEGGVPNSYERDKMKKQASKWIREGTETGDLDLLIKATEIFLKAYYARSIEQEGFRLDYISFEKYIQFFLKQNPHMFQETRQTLIWKYKTQNHG